MKLVKESFGDVYYDKALECVRVLREEAIKVSPSVLFWWIIFHHTSCDIKEKLLNTSGQYLVQWDLNYLRQLCTSSNESHSFIQLCILTNQYIYMPIDTIL